MQLIRLWNSAESINITKFADVELSYLIGTIFIFGGSSEARLVFGTDLYISIESGLRIKNTQCLNDIFIDFIKIIKENLCGFIDNKVQAEEILYAFSKIELYEIYKFEKYFKIFSKYIFILEYNKA